MMAHAVATSCGAAPKATERLSGHAADSAPETGCGEKNGKGQREGQRCLEGSLEEDDEQLNLAWGGVNGRAVDLKTPSASAM